jgi:hypothetical protein
LSGRRLSLSNVEVLLSNGDQSQVIGIITAGRRKSNLPFSFRGLILSNGGQR